MKEEKEEMKASKKQERIIYLIVAFIVIFLIVALIYSIPENYQPSDIENNTVVNIIDGDTFEYYDEDSGDILKVRLLCVDTPEKNKDGYEDATNYLSALIYNKQVRLVTSVKDKDAYGRLLRYVYVNEGGREIFVNKIILDSGYGELLIIPPETCDIM